MIILAIDTSCDETAVAVTDGSRILSNIIWSQASLHAKWGGVVPSLAKRAHKERIAWVVEEAVKVSGIRVKDLDAIAVTVGPGLAIALEVGIAEAKELALKWYKPLIPVNHLEGHIVSPLAWASKSKNKDPARLRMDDLPDQTSSVRSQAGVQAGGQKSRIVSVNFPALALIASGGHTELILVKKIGEYQVLARTIDDALGEALDKAARMLGLGYPGGAVLEKLAKEGNPSAYKFTLPLLGRENQGHFSYSGLKTAFYRLTNGKSFTKQEICDLAASFQNIALEHLTRVISRTISDYKNYNNYNLYNILIGGGVAANVELRRRLRKLAKELNLKIHFPYSKKLCTDNAAMIGVAAQFAFNRGEVARTPEEISVIDRRPDLNF